MDHSLDGYLKRQSTAGLISFLRWCMLQHKWSSYAYLVPKLMAMIRERGASVPESIQASWDAYRKKD